MRCRLNIVGSNLRRRSFDLSDVPRPGDVLWADLDPDAPSLRKLYVRQVEWFERYGPFDEPGVVITCSETP